MKTNHPRWVVALSVLGVVLIVGVVYYVWQGGPYTYNPFLGGWRKDVSIHGRGGVKGSHLEVHWPEKRILNDVRPAITLRIPREYVHAGTTYLNDQGNIEKVGVCFGLPRAKPVQPRAVRDPSVTRYCMDITPGGQGYMARTSYRPGNCSDIRRQHLFCIDKYIRDADVAGLERYSSKDCYTEKDLQRPEIRKYLDEKLAEDPTPRNCRLNRLEAVLITPPEIKADDQGVAIRCQLTGCVALFSVKRLNLAVNMDHKNLSRWQEIVEPARELAQSFVVMAISSDYVPLPQ